jgi:hypothetical protein
MLDATTVAAHFLNALSNSKAETAPYPHWLLSNMIPAATLAEIVKLPVPPPAINDTYGRRETHNSSRSFFAAKEQAEYACCRDLATALQSHEVVSQLEKTCNVNLKGSSLRIEYCLDTDGFWLEPHTDIGAKFFTMLIYLVDSPVDEYWGTDIYASPTDYVGTAPYAPNLGLIFIPGSDTWHGFKKRQITGVRRSLIVNYVTPEWRSRHELAFPETPVA